MIFVLSLRGDRMEEESIRKSSGLCASNGIIREGDRVHYDDGTMAFTAVVECHGDLFGVMLDGKFFALREFSFDPDDKDYGSDFQIVGEFGNPLRSLTPWIAIATVKRNHGQ